eukprot:Lithocolla_globosa_v1_NODE_3873_length_1560_cov_4.273754.p3 type:complete len:141 gc:universal NODE_3873_length_1560_cov_4.273754:1115-693(-)
MSSTVFAVNSINSSDTLGAVSLSRARVKQPSLTRAYRFCHFVTNPSLRLFNPPSSSRESVVTLCERLKLVACTVSMTYFEGKKPIFPSISPFHQSVDVFSSRVMTSWMLNPNSVSLVATKSYSAFTRASPSSSEFWKPEP